MKIKVVIDRDACQSITSCLSTAPEIYDLDSEAKSIVKNVKAKIDENKKYVYEFDASSRQMQKAVAGAESCPYLAIEVYNVETGRKIFPRGEK